MPPPFIITDFEIDRRLAPINAMYFELYATDGYVYDKWALENVRAIEAVRAEYTSVNNYSAYGYVSFGSKPVAGGQTYWGQLFPLHWEIHQIIPDIPYPNCFRFWLRPGVHGQLRHRTTLRKWTVPIHASP